METQINNPPLTPPPVQEPKKWYTHKGIIWIIALTVIAAVAVSLYLRKSSVNDNNLLGSVSQTGKVSLAQCKAKQYNPDKPNEVGDCYKQYGMESKDINSCKSIGVYPNDVSCAIGVAVAVGDIKICDQVSNFTSYEAPQYGVQGCRTGYAIANKNCEDFPFSQAGNTAYKPDRDNCFSGLASDTLDDSYCGKISSEYTKDACYQIVGQRKNDITICDKMVAFDLKDEFKGSCYLQIARSTKDTSICDRLTFFSNYQGVCYAEMASAHEDPSICEKIATQHDKDGCYQGIANKKADASLCDKVSVTEQRDYCLAGVSVKKKDLELCQQIGTLQYQQMCYQQITGKTQTDTQTTPTGDCSSLSSPIDQYNCYVKQAEIKNNPVLCNQMQSQDFKDNCYSQVAKDTKNPKLCAQVVTQKNKDNCYYALAAAVNDGKLCDTIVDQGLKNGCMLPFQLNQTVKPQLTVTMDLAMATLTGKAGETVKVTGTIENYSTETIYLNSMGGSLASTDLDLDTTDFFSIVPPSFKPGETYQGPLFGINIGSNIKAGDYFVNFYFTGGTSETASEDLTNQNLSITVK